MSFGAWQSCNQLVLIMTETDSMLQQINHSHPLSYLKQPDLLQGDPNSTLDIAYGILYSALPTIFSFELSRLPALIGIYFLGNYGTTEEFVEVGLGIIIAYILVYNVIVTVNLGFAAACVNMSNPEAIGLMYQKTLAVNFFYCIAVTPLLYLSDVILLRFFSGNDPQLELRISKEVGVIIWGLVLSFYLNCFHDTSRNYLHAQGVLYQPIILQTLSVIIQLLFSILFVENLKYGVMGMIWSKNIADGFYAIAIYLYIVIAEPTKESWIQWNLLSATRNWRFFLNYVGMFVITKYIQALAFELTCLVACLFVNLPALAAHICIANCVILIRLAYQGIADSVNYSIYKSLLEKNYRIAIKKFRIGLLVTLTVSFCAIYQLLGHRDNVVSLFSKDPQVIDEIQDLLPIIFAILMLEPLHALLSCFLNSMHMSRQITKVDILSFYFVSMGLSLFLCYEYEWGLWGIWTGWLAGLVLSCTLMGIILCKINYNKTANLMIQQVDARHKTIEQTVRESVRQSVRESVVNNSNLQLPSVEIIKRASFRRDNGLSHSV